MERIGLLAGVGHLPAEFAKNAAKEGYEVYAVTLLSDADPMLYESARDVKPINIAKLGSIVDYLKKNDVKKVTMLGKVTKEILFSGRHSLPDFRMIKFLASLKDRKDDTIMLGFVAELAKEGIEVLDQTELIRLMMPQRGLLTKRAPTEAELADMKFGFGMAKELGRLDVGQTVVVKDLAVMALEAIEGTDACIERGGALARGGAVVVKVAKPKQDRRFDVPAVGLATIETMARAGAVALAIEAESTILVDREEALAFADSHGIAIMSM